MRSRFAEERELAKQAFDTFEGLHSRQIIEDELLSGENCNSATASTSKVAWVQRPSPHSSTASTLMSKRNSSFTRPSTRPTVVVRFPRSVKQKAIKRLKIVTAFNRRDETRKACQTTPGAMILGAVAGYPAGPASDGAA